VDVETLLPNDKSLYEYASILNESIVYVGITNILQNIYTLKKRYKYYKGFHDKCLLVLTTNKENNAKTLQQ